jgi:hypothetical protein
MKKQSLAKLRKRRASKSPGDVSSYSKDEETGEQVQDISRKKLLNVILNRVKLNYTGWDILKDFLSCACCRRLKSRNDKNKYRQQVLYRKAIAKLDNNFDSLAMLKTMQQINLLAPILLDPNQKMLMHFQKS